MFGLMAGHRLRHISFVASLLTMSVLIASPAFAGDGGSLVTGHKDTVTVTNVQPASGGSGGSGGGGPTYGNCYKQNVIIAFTGGLSGLFSEDSGPTLITSDIAWQTCTDLGTGADASWLTVPTTPGALVDPTPDLVAQAMASIVIDVPAVELSPPHGGTQLVGVPVWVWSTNHEPVSATASIPGLSATLTATPGDVQVDLGDGTGFTCSGAGIPYDESASYKGQHSDCSGAYDEHGRYTLTVTVVWSLTWVATNGQSGTLPPIIRSTALDLAVQQAQAVTD